MGNHSFRPTAKIAAAILLATAVMLAEGEGALAGDAGPAGVPAPESVGVPLEKEQALRLTGVIEAGFLAVLDHKVQFSRDGTRFDYRDEGGQDTLFFVQRYSVEVEIEKAHAVIFLYQPLRLETSVELERTLRVDGLDFPAGSVVDLLYDFPFYRMSYLFDLMPESRHALEIGLSLQIRNARISFRSGDGTLYRENRDVGPVPLLKVRGRWAFHERLWLETEMDGVYAPISYLNGSDTEVVGALLDASARAGASFKSMEFFVNLRYLGGGAVGESDDSGPGDGYVRNWLHFFIVSLGLKVSVM